jgi:hypothetical protein
LRHSEAAVSGAAQKRSAFGGAASCEALQRQFVLRREIAGLRSLLERDVARRERRGNDGRYRRFTFRYGCAFDSRHAAVRRKAFDRGFRKRIL